MAAIAVHQGKSFFCEFQSAISWVICGMELQHRLKKTAAGRALGLGQFQGAYGVNVVNVVEAVLN